MNKIFKVIYSKTRHCYVVVSELAKSHCKTTQSHTVRSKTALTAAVLLALGAFSFVGMPSVQADADAHNNDFIGANDYYWYWDKDANKWQQQTYHNALIGHLPRKGLPNNEGAGAKETGSIAAGLYAQAGMQTVTIGNRNAGQSRGSVFIGELGNPGEVSGYDDKAGNNPKGSGNNYVTSVGFQSYATGWGSIAIGSNARAENSKKTDPAVAMTEDKTNNIYVIEKKPTIEGASVALGYDAHSKDGNIAIGAYSDATTDLSADTSETAKSYLTKESATSYVSVGSKDVQRRISNVADGASASDVATVGQLQALSKELGGYKAGFGIQIDPDSTDKTKNTISLNRNLGTNYTDKAHQGDEKVTVAVDDTGLVLGGYAEDEKGNKKNPAVTYGATGDDSVTVGGKNSLASGKGSVVTGGVENIASGATAVAIGGNNNDAIGTRSAVLGGLDNTAFGDNSMVSGGVYNVAGGIHSAVLGGFSNYALGTGTTSIGGYGKDYGTGYDSSVNGDYSVGVAGGSTGKDAKYALAAGHQAVVTTENGTAIGYQATTDEANTIAFGHDAGDVSGYTIEWNKLPEGQVNADGTTNDYTQAPKSVTPTTYKDAYYNRLVKVADGVDDHDVVVMEQLTKATNDLTKDLSVNAGWGINIADEKDPKTGEVTKKNVISLNRNLGTNNGNTEANYNGKVSFEAKGKNSLILGGEASTTLDTNVTAGTDGDYSVLVGGYNNSVKSAGKRAVVAAGSYNKASGENSAVIGGSYNQASGDHSVVIGGGEFSDDKGNQASGQFSTIIGGDGNKAKGINDVVSGGYQNITSGDSSFIGGGQSNKALGYATAILGGAYNMGVDDTTVVGGQLNLAVSYGAFAAGGSANQVAGFMSAAIGGEKQRVIGNYSTAIGGASTGIDAEHATAIGSHAVVTSKNGLALGYKATADKEGTISFGHDKGDVSGYESKIEYGPYGYYSGEVKSYMVPPASGEDTRSVVYTPTYYESAEYNRLVKVADGKDAHDAVVMEQLKPYTKSDASNVGANLKTYTVGDDGETITEDDATADQKNANKDAWGRALGAGTFTTGTDTTATNASTSDKLVTGKTLYDYDKPTGSTNYVKVNNTTGQNLSALDAQVKANADKGLKFAANSGAEYTAKLGSTVKIQGTAKKEGHEYTADNLTTEIDENGNITILMDKDMSVEKLAVNGKDGKDGAPGTPGSIGINGRDGQSGVGIDGKDGISIKGKDGKDGVTMKAVDGKDGTEGHIGLTGPTGTNGIKGADGQPRTSIDITVKNGYDGANGVNGKNGVDGTSLTRIVYTDGASEHQVATMEDGMKYAGDDAQNDTTKVIAKKLNNTLDIIGGADSNNLTEGNIGVNSTDKGQLKVQLAKDLKGITSIGNQTTTKVDGKDVTTGAKITLGADGTTTISGGDVNVSGNKITHVGSGIEKDANGKYTVTDQNKGNAANISDVQNMVNDAKIELISGDNGLNNKANIDASNIGANLKGEDGKTPASDDEKNTNENAWGKAIGTGKIEANNGQLVTGDTVYNEVRPKEDGNYVKTNQTTGANLSALDSKIGKLDETKEYNYIDSKESTSISDNLTKLDTQVKKNADDITNINNSISSLNQNAVKYDDSSKSKISLGGEGGTTITNVKDGSVKKDSKDAVNGGQLWQVDQKVDTNTTNITKNAGDITNLKNLSNITDAGKTVIKNLSKDAVQIKAGTAITVDGKVDETTGNKTYTISANNNGKVAKDDGNLISGDTLYKEVHVDKDGSYIKGSQTVGQNLSALDSGLKTTSDLIHTNAKGDTIQIGGNSTATKIDVSGKDKDGNTTGRVITGVMTDGKDLTSAANVGYVNGITSANTQQIYRDMNNAYSRLDTNINRAAAGSNALAALHPLDFDPADKASFAVGYGHYHNANAAAVGAFYQPNANTMVNMGISLGNGDPGFNAGVSFKIGKGSAYNGVSKAEMAQTIHDQAEEISAIKANDAAKDKRIDALEKENQEMKKQIQEILSRLNG